ncbi:4310_t:CDS:2, partial [Entrophospora sp. SA101]
ANLSRYFIQRLLLQYGQEDEGLIKLRLQGNNNDKAFQKGIKTPWSSDIPMDVDIEVENHYKMLEFLKDYKNGIELEFVFLKSIISHFFGTKIKRDFDNLEILIMQSILSVKDYENYVRQVEKQIPLKK